jgi:prolyl-tRNA synthetase
MSEPGKEGITARKADNFDEWYTQVILRGEIADYTPVSGCLAFRPSGYYIWETIQRATDAEFKRVGIQNTYFPLFIPERLLKKEAEHVEGFSPEVAWVTQTGSSPLEERLAVRPTSETVMYEVVSRWVRSWRDLPMRLNQWNNVVRWEFRHPTPFLRSREFLWNEGHSIYATKEDAEGERDEILGIYRMITEELLALPGCMGRKSDSEKFAGAEASYSIEHLLPDGKAIQGPDFHSDGQRFSKAFGIVFVDRDGENRHAWQNTWAISTREIGVMLAVHGDDRGAIIPPRLAYVQVVVVPIVNEETKATVLEEAARIARDLSKEFRVKLDDRDNLTPGRKFNEWELKGVPLRLEIGPRDLKARQVVMVRRDTGAKRPVPMDGLSGTVGAELGSIQKGLLEKARAALEANTHDAASMPQLKETVATKGGIVRVAWCGDGACEAKMKDAGGKILNIPFEQPKEAGPCVACGRKGTATVNYGKSY